MTEKRMQEMLAALSSGGIHVAGDFVMEKNIVHNVEAGGIGFQIVRGKGARKKRRRGPRRPLPSSLLPKASRQGTRSSAISSIPR